MRTDKLNAHDSRFDPPDHEKQQRVTEIEYAQPLVIDSRHPVVQRIVKGRDASSVLGNAMASVDMT
ncbi:MAG TPA: hypothetical protein VGK96_14170 [Candidatus Sulfotelmatobacter sp.]